jgi:hypothetical protein
MTAVRKTTKFAVIFSCMFLQALCNVAAEALAEFLFGIRLSTVLYENVDVAAGDAGSCEHEAKSWR